MSAITMKLSDAWRVILPELAAATVAIWSEDDYEDEPAFRQIAADIEAGNMTPDVLKELQNKMDCDWITPKLRRAALVVLAENNELEAFDPNTTRWSSSGRKPKTQVIN